MNMHEALWFIRKLHDFIEAGVQNKGPWCWPERGLLYQNLKDNAEAFGDTRDGIRRHFGAQLSHAKREGWVEMGGCQPHCHAKHVKLTPEGEARLLYLERGACGEPQKVVGRPRRYRPLPEGVSLHRKPLEMH